jgi:hypothetical protein
MRQRNCFHFEQRAQRFLFALFLQCACSFASMKAFFQPVDLAAHRQQIRQIAEHLKEHPPARASSPQPKRGVGRPKLKRPAAEVMAAAAAADALQLPDHKRGKYTRWFSSPYINDIIAAYTRTGSARAAVAALKQSAPDDRYERLSHSTVASWFENGQLKSQHQQELEAGYAFVAGKGRIPALQAAPDAEEKICDILLKLRKAGTPLNSHIIRWVMSAVLQETRPTVLHQLTLSQAYISTWVRNNPRLHFRWRARTTAASKLPDDWEERGIHMAQRMGATMQLHKVRSTVTHALAMLCQLESRQLRSLLLGLLLCSDSSISRGQHGSDRRTSRVCFVLDIRDAGQQRRSCSRC